MRGNYRFPKMKKASSSPAMNMTAFFTRCCKKLSLLALVGGLSLASWADAAGIKVERAELVSAEDVYQLEADLDINFSPEVEEAVNKGVALSFLVEFALMEERKYWFDEEVASASQTVRLSYHALSRQYLINVGSHQATYATLAEAQKALGRLQGWPVLEKSQVGKTGSYFAMLLMRLDHNRLPKPLQVTALGSDKWNLVSERYRWTPGFDKPAQEKASDKPASEKPIVIDRSISDK